jgi:hypothetical protein
MLKLDGILGGLTSRAKINSFILLNKIFDPGSKFDTWQNLTRIFDSGQNNKVHYLGPLLQKKDWPTLTKTTVLENLANSGASFY